MENFEIVKSVIISIFTRLLFELWFGTHFINIFSTHIFKFAGKYI